MSIVITGLDLPKCCIDCPIYDNEFGQCNCIPNSRFYKNQHRKPMNFSSLDECANHPRLNEG